MKANLYLQEEHLGVIDMPGPGKIRLDQVPSTARRDTVSAALLPPDEEWEMSGYEADRPSHAVAKYVGEGDPPSVERLLSRLEAAGYTYRIIADGWAPERE